MSTPTSPGFDARVGLLGIGAWIAYLLVSFVNGFSEPQQSSVIARTATLVVLLVPSVLLFRFVLLRERKRSRAASFEAERVLTERKEQERFAATQRAKALAEPVLAVVEGGSGSGVSPGELVLLSCRPNELILGRLAARSEVKIPFNNIRSIEISGPGTVRTNAGAVGGGFGIEGALKGILVASVINAATSKATTNTYVLIASRGSEIHLHTAARDPRQLRLDLSAAFVAIESTR